MSTYLKYKQLWFICKKELEGAATKESKTQALEVWLIFNSKIAPKIFNRLNSVCGQSLYKIWNELKTNYATATIYRIYQVWKGYR